MILLIDNYDSFVYNLARYSGGFWHDRHVVRNDALTLDDIAALRPSAIILSPGPGKPSGAGICIDAVRRFGPEIPILGVCLGHQCIAQAYGGRTVPAEKPVHGKSDLIGHTGGELFAGLPNPLQVARYHSLTVDLPANADLLVTATNDEGMIMALRHSQFPVYGVQFHPESILTERGADLMRNFSAICARWNAHRPIAPASSAA